MRKQTFLLTVLTADANPSVEEKWIKKQIDNEYIRCSVEFISKTISPAGDNGGSSSMDADDRPVGDAM